jgi:hypothetical protein
MIPHHSHFHYYNIQPQPYEDSQKVFRQPSKE